VAQGPSSAADRVGESVDPRELAYDGAGLVTVVAQDRLTGEVRMLAHANLEAIEKTLETGKAHFFSRSRQALWRKGESSGHELVVHEVWVDCDADAVVYLVDPSGPTCHTGSPTCFFRPLTQAKGAKRANAPHAQPQLPRLFSELLARRDGQAQTSYTKRLLSQGASAVCAKIAEESGELIAAIESESDERVVSEAADVVYHLLVGLLSRGLGLRDVEAELARRAGVSGLVEKASRTAK